MKNKMKLNLGCGKDIKKGYINCDSIKYPGVDMIHNLNNYPYTLKNSEFDEIYAKDIMEHLDKPNDFIRELWRIGKNGCKIKIITPHFSSPYAWNDLTHIKPFGSQIFFHYDVRVKENASLNSISGVRFLVKSRIQFSKWHKLLGIEYFANRFVGIYESFFAFIFQARNVVFDLEVVKKY